MALVPHESRLNSNRTEDPSVCLGPQLRSSRLVLSGCTVGQVAMGVVTTVMTPSAEQTDATETVKETCQKADRLNSSI